MDSVRHPLDWWAHGGYAEVVRNTGWNFAKARREVRKAIHPSKEPPPRPWTASPSSLTPSPRDR